HPAQTQWHRTIHPFCFEQQDQKKIQKKVR
ncbi:MAG: hypothetical protein RJA92_1297, partial [Bacteroidota bacterium]